MREEGESLADQRGNRGWGLTEGLIAAAALMAVLTILALVAEAAPYILLVSGALFATVLSVAIGAGIWYFITAMSKGGTFRS